MISLNIFRFHYIPHCPQTFEVQVPLLLVQKMDEVHILPTHIRLRIQNKDCKRSMHDQGSRDSS
jgi:hypothetical protein